MTPKMLSVQSRHRGWQGQRSYSLASTLWQLRMCRILGSETKELRLSISAGVASTETGQSAHDLLQSADRALYGAKRKGKNCVYRIADLARDAKEESMTLRIHPE